MKIAVMGSGGVGGYFGARLAAAGGEVAFIARGRHLAALREAGLRIDSQLGDIHLSPVRASDRPEEIGPVDIVLFAVKLWDTDAAAEACRPLTGPDTAVVCLQNGVAGPERLAAILGARHAVGGTAHIAAVIAEPGRIRHTGTMARITFGELDGSASPRLSALLALCQAAKVDAAVSADIRRAIWEKLVLLASFSGMTALTRLPKGPLLADPETRALFHAALREVVAVGQAEGVALGADLADKTLAFADGLPAQMKTSMQQDLERGGRLELEWLSGTVARLGRARGVDTPVHRFIAAALHPWADGAPGA